PPPRPVPGSSGGSPGHTPQSPGKPAPGRPGASGSGIATGSAGASSGNQRKSLSIPPVAHSILGSRTTLWSPSRKSALSVPIDGTRSTGSAAHSGNCASRRRRTSGISIGSSAACIRMPGACPSDRERQRVHRKLGQEDLQRRLELLDDLLVHQQPLVVELRRSVADYDLCLDDPCARGGEHLAELRLRPH